MNFFHQTTVLLKADGIFLKSKNRPFQENELMYFGKKSTTFSSYCVYEMKFTPKVNLCSLSNE